jgi:poly(3-hydroxybutyrate) depolymerase
MPDSALFPGRSHFSFTDPRAGERREITVHVHRPAGFTPDSPVLIVMHGRSRNAREYRDAWIPESEARGILIAAPEFSEACYPGVYHYNFADMVTPDGTARPRRDWTFALIDRIFEALVARAGSRRERYRLFGHSAGGQFVHRMVTFAFSDRVEHAVAANSGSYTLPVADEAFPFGLEGFPLTDDERRTLFARPLTIVLGDADSDPNHPQLPRDPGAMRQGPFRFARGLNYLAVACRESTALACPLAWKLRIAPNVAHSNPGIAPYAARALFE